MGSAIAKGLSNHELIVCDKNEGKLEKFRGLKVTSEISQEVVKENEIVILAVKPCDSPTLLADLKPHLNGQLVLSVMAGVSLQTLQEGLGTDLIIRVMPNMPALIGEGISGWVAGFSVSDEQKALVREVLSSFGDEIEVENEDQIDMVTALSGCGPAYIFYFLQSLIEGGQKLGLNKEISRKLALKTFIGALKLAESSDDDLEILINKVASKGGTTEAALKVFEEKAVRDVVVEAMRKAYERSKELGS